MMLRVRRGPLRDEAPSFLHALPPRGLPGRDHAAGWQSTFAVPSITSLTPENARGFVWVLVIWRRKGTPWIEEVFGPSRHRTRLRNRTVANPRFYVPGASEGRFGKASWGSPR